MKILYLYDRMKFGGPGNISARQFIDFLQRHTFIDHRYAVVSDEYYANFDRDDPGASELTTSSAFFSASYDTIIQSGPLFQANGICRIDENALQAFWRKGGIALFLWHVSDFHFGRSAETAGRLEKMRTLFGKSGHAQVSIYTPSSEGDYITGLQGQSDRVRISINDEYLAYFDDEVKKLYSNVRMLVVEKPVNLGHFCRALCIGDDSTWMVDSLDQRSECPRPLVFGGVSFGNGICAAITGHFVNDYVLDQDPSDNIQFLFNVLNYFSAWQHSFPGHLGKITVFISYSHVDKERVNVICERLVSAGVRVWRDEKEIKVGQSITGTVEDGLRKADYFLLVMSASSVKSAWVEMEYRTALTTALKRKKLGMILPVVLDGIPVEELSLFLGDRKYADCTNLESGMQQILEAVGV